MYQLIKRFFFLFSVYVAHYWIVMTQQSYEVILKVVYVV